MLQLNLTDRALSEPKMGELRALLRARATTEGRTNRWKKKSEPGKEKEAEEPRVHLGWAFLGQLVRFRRFEKGGWQFFGHWRTDGYTVSVTLRRPRAGPRPGDPPPPTSTGVTGKRTRAGGLKDLPKDRGRKIADEYYR